VTDFLRQGEAAVPPITAEQVRRARITLAESLIPVGAGKFDPKRDVGERDKNDLWIVMTMLGIR
jgi:hypothetical protein